MIQGFPMSRGSVAQSLLALSLKTEMLRNRIPSLLSRKNKKTKQKDVPFSFYSYCFTVLVFAFSTLSPLTAMLEDDANHKLP